MNISKGVPGIRSGRTLLFGEIGGAPDMTEKWTGGQILC